MKKTSFFLAAACLALLASCATIDKEPARLGLSAVTAIDDGTIQAGYAPVYIIENPQKTYNLIGTPTARTGPDATEKVYVDPKKPTIYFEKRTFRTGHAEYTNLIYRVHFEKVPFDLYPFLLGSGENVGLFVVVTLNSSQRPLLYTIVHTCGCYLAFIPTSHLPDTAFPKDWDRSGQTVFGENLPGILDFPSESEQSVKPVLTIRDASHRVKQVRLTTETSLHDFEFTFADLAPLETLGTLEIEDGRTTSFYETSGPGKDYVKSSSKIWERILMSWWAFDWRVGEDKRLGKDKDDGIVFYTSLKPWNREASDMRNFADFLKFWGWNL